MEQFKAPTDMDSNAITQQLAGTKLDADGDYDIIKKPRTNFTNNVLRRAIPKINIQDKIGSISLNKLNVISAMKIGTISGSNNNLQGGKRIKTVTNLPKMQSLDSSMMNVMMPPGKKQSKLPAQPVHEEADEGDDNDEESNSDNSSSHGDESSIDMDGDDEEKLYEQIL